MARRRILAATDDSPAGQHAVAQAERLSAAVDARLEVIQVFEGGATPPAVSHNGRTLCTGIPGIEIVRHADSIRADLLVLGRHLRGAVGSPRLGPTADGVVRRSRIPCLFVPADQGAYTEVVVALDGTERGMLVLDCAERMFTWVEAKRIVPVTVEPLQHRGVDRGAHTPSGRELLLRDRMEVRSPRLTGPGDLVVRYGDPVGGVLGVIGHPEGAMLVVGNHRGGPAGVVTSTGVGRSLLYTAPCAVLTVPL